MLYIFPLQNHYPANAFTSWCRVVARLELAPGKNLVLASACPQVKNNSRSRCPRSEMARQSGRTRRRGTKKACVVTPDQCQAFTCRCPDCCTQTVIRPGFPPVLVPRSCPVDLSNFVRQGVESPYLMRVPVANPPLHPQTFKQCSSSRHIPFSKTHPSFQEISLSPRSLSPALHRHPFNRAVTSRKGPKVVRRKPIRPKKSTRYSSAESRLRCCRISLPVAELQSARVVVQDTQRWHWDYTQP